MVFSILTNHAVKNEGGNVLILAHRDELIRQAADKLQVSTGLDCAIEKANETGHDSFHKVVVASVQTLSIPKRLARYDPNHFDYIIVDETHRVLAKTYQRILKHFTSAKVLGVTATAMRGDKQSLGKFFEEIAHEYRLKDAINDGWLTPIEAETCPVEIDISEANVNAGEYAARDISCAIEPHLSAIADQLIEKARDRKILLFLPLVATSKSMAQILTEKGVECRSVDGKMSKEDRAETLEWYRNAPKGTALCNSMLLTEGFDQPDIDCIVVLRATKSSGLYRQMIGRGTRVLDESINQEGLTAEERRAIIQASDKKNMLILDFLWLTSHHRLCSPATLVAQTEETEEVVRQRQDKAGRVSLDELEDMALTCEQEAREEALAANLDGLKGRKAAKINPVIEALSLFDDKIISWEPRNQNEMMPSTDTQRQALESMGFKGSEEWSAGFAHKILDTIKCRREAGLCTPKQLKILVKYGVPKAQDKTFEQASSIIDGLSKSWKRGRARRR
jgi:superfamily II DNA or RNA helicase